MLGARNMKCTEHNKRTFYKLAFWKNHNNNVMISLVTAVWQWHCNDKANNNTIKQLNDNVDNNASFLKYSSKTLFN